MNRMTTPMSNLLQPHRTRSAKQLSVQKSVEVQPGTCTAAARKPLVAEIRGHHRSSTVSYQQNFVFFVPRKKSSEKKRYRKVRPERRYQRLLLVPVLCSTMPYPSDSIAAGRLTDSTPSITTRNCGRGQIQVLDVVVGRSMVSYT